MSQKDSPGKLELELIELIKEKGPITFFEFMELALYHPTEGFYSSVRRGPGTDYQTSPALTPAFGHLLGHAFTAWCRSLEADFLNVVEVGGGTGALAAAILESQSKTRWTFVEKFKSNVEAQRRAAWGGRGCSWIKDLSEADPFVGCLLANEVLDNFPVHVFEIRETPLEVFVSMEGNRFVEVLRQPSSESLRDRAAQLAEPLDEGDRFEIRPGVAHFVELSASALAKGYILIIDYGDESPALQVANPSGTVVTYRTETLGVEPLESPGTADITAHVDFSELRSELEKNGFERVQLLTQAAFLEALRIGELEESVEKNRRAAEAEGRHADFVSLTAEKGRLHALRAESGMGKFKVLLASKNAPPPDL